MPDRSVRRPLISLCTPAFAVVAAATLVASCDDESVEMSPVPASETSVEVSLSDSEGSVDSERVAPGPLVFEVANAGARLHNLLVVRTELPPEKLPTAADGSYLENGMGTSVVGELGDIAPGTTADLEVNLTQGNYVLLSNVFQGDLAASDYAIGIRTAFTVIDTPIIDGPVQTE